MGNIRKKNPETGKWEIFGSSDAVDIKILDILNNYRANNVEEALREIAERLKDNALNSEYEAMLQTHEKILKDHEEQIEWLKVNGGGGGGGGGGTAVPTITSKFEDCVVKKGTVVKIPIFFSSPNLGSGIAYIMINGIEVGSVPNIKQGNNTIEIPPLTELNNSVSIYVKDRANLLSNQLDWNIVCGGIEVTIDFDDTTDYIITDEIIMQYNVTSSSTEPVIMHMTIDYDSFEVTSFNGFNEYKFPQLGVGVHRISFYLTSGEYETEVFNYNIVIVDATSLYLSTTFQGGQFVYGTPVSIQYRVSKAGDEFFDVNLYLNDKLEKTQSVQAGTYYWIINNLEMAVHNFKIEVSSAYGELKTLEGSFEVVQGEYTPLKINTSGLAYRLSAEGRTNQDSDKENPLDISGNGITTTLHNFNYYTNGWIDDELVCNGNAYVEIDLKPWETNAIYGSTIELQFTGNDIGFNDSRIIDYTDIYAPYKGFYVDLEESTMKSLANSGTVTLDKDTETTLTFVIDRKNKFAKIYINGICSRAFALSDSGSGTNAVREDFTHNQKIYINSRKGQDKFGACKVKDLRVYNRVLTDDEIVQNYIAQVKDLDEQEKLYRFNYENTSLPTIRMYGDTKDMTLETPVTMRIKYTSPNAELYGQSFDLPYCEVNWQGTSSLQYVLKNFTARLRDENMSDYMYTPYPNGVLENVYCFKAD